VGPTHDTQLRSIAVPLREITFYTETEIAATVLGTVVADTFRVHIQTEIFRDGKCGFISDSTPPIRILYRHAQDTQESNRADFQAVRSTQELRRITGLIQLMP
jgi:hypothetical protein